MNNSAPMNQRGGYRLPVLLLFTFVFVNAAVTLYAQGSSVRVETFSLKPDGGVFVENSRGATRVESWDYQTVRITAEKKDTAGSPMGPGELVLMSAQNSVIVQCKQGSGRIDLTLYVPNGTRLQLTGGAWPVDIAGALANAVVDTTSGNISYRLPSDDDARVTMRSEVGVVRSTVPLTAVERTGTHSIQGQIGTGAAQLVLNSQKGNVTLTPGPILTANARAAKSGIADSVANTKPGQAATSTPSEVDTQARMPQPGGGTSAQRKRDQTGDTDANDPGATRQAVQSNGSIDFAGSDRSNDSSMTTTSGPLTRPRVERNTSGGNSGLKVRIIPSNEPARGSRDAAGSVFDQQTDDEDAQKGGKSTKGSASSTPGATPGYSANGSMVFGGSDLSDDGSSKARVGPLERDRQSRNTSGGNSGLRVRIIPANAPPGPVRGSNSVFDQRDDTAKEPAVAEAASPRASDTGTSTRRDAYAQQEAPRRQADPTAGTDDEISSARSRAAAPPILRRSDDDSSSAPAADAGMTAPHDEGAIVLKAALVNLNVSVTTRAGVALANLKKEDFEVAENNQPQKIEFFQPTTAPFNLVLALDLSGSIKDKLDVVKSAALRFIEILSPQDKVAVVTFTDEIRVVSQLTNDREELKRRIKAVDRSQGGTAFYEALWFSLVDTLRGTRGQRNAIVVMTDGVDSSLDRYNPMESRVSFNQLARRLEESDVLVFPIYIDTEYEEVFERGNSSSEAYAVSRDQLERISELTGGQMFKAEKFGDLSGVYKQVAAAIRTVYSVGYYPTNPERDGTFRRVRVGVNRADAAVRTRKGYYAK